MSDKGLYKKISDAARRTPDPERAQRNLLRLFEEVPERELVSERETFLPYINEIARLFSYSQFLANFSCMNPGELLSSLGGQPAGELELEGVVDPKEAMRRIRRYKKRRLLDITLKDVSGESDILSSMDALSALAEGISEAALKWALDFNAGRYGQPEGGPVLSIIGVGKLGGAELNYSSDIDIMAVYGETPGSAEMQTSGVVGPTGIRINRIETHEFYAKTVELFTSLLSIPTEEGIAYRVDLRLRPQGRKGELALPLSAYVSYYGSWGRTWERMVLIRARPVAGDKSLGLDFIKGVEPFVWGKISDYTEIEEIRAMKKKIDSLVSRDDIKRGYGGIREAEFFVQTFQLIYGTGEPSLRTHSLLEAIQALIRMRMIPEKDLLRLSENYLYLRRLEHYLQMKDDLQTHALPPEDETEALGRKMGFGTKREFLSDLKVRRMEIKSMYNTLLGAEEDVHAETLALIEGELSAEELAGYLSFRGLASPEDGVRRIEAIKEHMGLNRTRGELSLMRRVVPELLEKALRAESPDSALAGIESFLREQKAGEPYLAALIEQRPLSEGLIKIFSLSPYLRRVFFSSPLYFGMLIEEAGVIRKTLKRLEDELSRSVRRAGGLSSGIAGFKRFEELRLGMFFLMGVIDAEDLHRHLTHVAEACIGAALKMKEAAVGGFAVIALGKLGGREMTFGSDIDIIFLAEGPYGPGQKTAESVIQALTAYTESGAPYEVDMRLRPDGSRGILVNDLEGYGSYYLKSAHPWELQALMKARPVAGDPELGRSFVRMAREIILKRGREIKKDDVRAMRRRVVEELSREKEGMDIKLGPGGIEDIEFFVQTLQLNHPSEGTLVQRTATAIRRLGKAGVLEKKDADILVESYSYLRRLETFLRLNEAGGVIREKDAVVPLAAGFMGHKTTEEFISSLKKIRKNRPE